MSPDDAISRHKSDDQPAEGLAAHTPRARGGLRRVVVGVFRVLLPLVVVAAGVAGAARFMATGPKARQKQRVREARLVDAAVVRTTSHRTVVGAMGTVCPARVIDLKPYVSGHIVRVSDEFMPGGRFRTGDTLVAIERRDYDLVVRQRTSDVAQAASNLKLELGQQSVAKREYEMLGQTVKPEDRELVLREPQLASVRARLEAARAALDKAKLDLSRTTVTSPFNAIVRSRDVDLGSHVTSATTLATLVGTDQYWVAVAVPVDRLQWIDVPRTTSEPGSLVRVYNEAAWGRDVFRTGRVCRLESDLETEGRMARVLVTVTDPLSLRRENAGQPTLLIGSYVRVEIEGRVLDSAVSLSRDLLHDGNRVWVIAGDNKLDIRPVTIGFRGRDHVLVTRGLKLGERVVTTDLAAPVQGMPLRVDTGRPPSGAPGTQPARSPGTRRGRP